MKRGCFEQTDRINPLIHISATHAHAWDNRVAFHPRVPRMSQTSLGHHPGLTEAMQLLLGCHADIRRLSERMLRLDIHLIHYGLDDAARETAHDILDYFEHEVPLHHADERGDLFPALRRLRDTRITRSLDALDTEHDALTRMWRSVRPWLAGIEARQAPQRPTVLGAFAVRYPAYADWEEREVFSAIGRLPVARIVSLAEGMRGRRALHTAF